MTATTPTTPAPGPNLPKAHIPGPPHVTGDVIGIGVAVLVVIGLVVTAVLLQARHTMPIDQWARRRPWDWRGVRSYRGQSKNKHVTDGLAVPAGRPIRRGLLGSRLGRPVGAGWEHTTLVLGGPRVGKSMSYIVSPVATAPGAVVATSNRRDIVDCTRGIRQEKGRVWLFDPEHVVGEPGSWWWNPLGRVAGVVEASELAQVWMDTSKAPGAVADAYFEPAGLQLLSGLILAAATAGRPASTVFWWLTDPQRAHEAVEILDPKGGPTPQTVADVEAHRGYEATAAAVEGVINLPDRQRAGVFGTAAKAVDWMQAAELRSWIEDPGGGREEFKPEAFAASTDTLYSLSREASTVLRPLVTALTADVLLRAERAATALPGGRLAVPMLAALDEAANTCPWQRLPQSYSFFGSRGISLVSVFQSPAQMRIVFGPEGAQALMGASNVRITMGGVEDSTHLANLEKQFGTVRVKERSLHRGGKGGGSSTLAWRDRQAVTVDQLVSMKQNRAAVTFSACSPMLVQPQPWWTNRQLKGQVQASIERFGPSAVVSLPIGGAGASGPAVAG